MDDGRPSWWRRYVPSTVEYEQDQTSDVGESVGNNVADGGKEEEGEEVGKDRRKRPWHDGDGLRCGGDGATTVPAQMLWRMYHAVYASLAPHVERLRWLVYTCGLYEGDGSLAVDPVEPGWQMKRMIQNKQSCQRGDGPPHDHQQDHDGAAERTVRRLCIDVKFERLYQWCVAALTGKGAKGSGMRHQQSGQGRGHHVLHGCPPLREADGSMSQAALRLVALLSRYPTTVLAPVQGAIEVLIYHGQHGHDARGNGSRRRSPRMAMVRRRAGTASHGAGRKSRRAAKVPVPLHRHDVFVRVISFPVRLPIEKLKVRYIERLVSVCGSIVRASHVHPVVYACQFQCGACKKVVSCTFAPSLTYAPPTMCEGCSSRRSMDIVPSSIRTVEYQSLRIQQMDYDSNGTDGSGKEQTGNVHDDVHESEQANADRDALMRHGAGEGADVGRTAGHGGKAPLSGGHTRTSGASAAATSSGGNALSYVDVELLDDLVCKFVPGEHVSIVGVVQMQNVGGGGAGAGGARRPYVRAMSIRRHDSTDSWWIHDDMYRPAMALVDGAFVVTSTVCPCVPDAHARACVHATRSDMIGSIGDDVQPYSDGDESARRSQGGGQARRASDEQRQMLPLGVEGALPLLEPDDMMMINNIAQMGPHALGILTNSFCPSVFGMHAVKASILLSLFGGTTRRLLTNISETWDPNAEQKNKQMHQEDVKKGSMEVEWGHADGQRSDVHVLLVGDPGMAKSQLLQAATRISPKGMYVPAASGSSAAGLTVTLVREPLTGEFAVEAGALVLCDMGVCCLDELDKIDRTVAYALLEAMEQQTVSLAKGGIVAALQARTTVIAAANPVKGVYDDTISIVRNIGLPEALINRFDLIMLIRHGAQHDEADDAHLAARVLRRHANTDGGRATRYRRQGSSRAGSSRASANRVVGAAQNTVGHWHPEMDAMLALPPRPIMSMLNLEAGGGQLLPQWVLKKYIAYARHMCHPVLSVEARDALVDAYVRMRSGLGREESGVGYQRIATRQLQSLLRLSQAFARLELTPLVTTAHVHRAVVFFECTTMEALSDAFYNPAARGGAGGRTSFDAGASSGGNSAVLRGKGSTAELKMMLKRIVSVLRARQVREIDRHDLATILESLYAGGGAPGRAVLDGCLDALGEAGYLLKRGGGKYKTCL